MRSRARARDACARGSPTRVPRGRRVRAVSLGRAAPRAGRRARSTASSAGAIDPTAAQAELKASAVRVEPVPARAPCAAPARRAPRGSSSSAAGMAGDGDRRGAARARRGERLGRHDRRRRARPALQPRPALAAARRRRRRPRARRCATRSWFATRGVDAAPRRARRAPIDTGARTVELADGEALAYDDARARDRLAPVRPAGPRRRACRASTSSARGADARAILAAAAAARRAVVIGGGLLGLEAARGLRERGVRGDRRPPRRPAHGAAARRPGRLAAGARAARPADRRAHRRPHRGDRRATAASSASCSTTARSCRPTSSSSPPACGPDVDLARAAGLEVERGILVDDELRTSAPGVRAVGECAEHRGNVYGLWAPLLEQARALGASLAGRPGGVPRRGAGDDAQGRGHRAVLLRRASAAARRRRRGPRARHAPRPLPPAARRRRRPAGRRDPARRPARRPRAARAAAQRRGGAGGAARRPPAPPDAGRRRDDDPTSTSARARASRAARSSTRSATAA